MEIIGVDGDFIIFLQNLNVIYSNNASAGLPERPVNAIRKYRYSPPRKKKEQERIPQEQ
jgi:hypothetical protein